MERVTIPYSGTLMVSHLAAYGLAFVLDDAGIDTFVSHDADSQSFEPVVSFAAERDDARAAIRESAQRLEALVEHDVEPGKRGNNRRATIWARLSLERTSERLQTVVALRSQLVEEADRAPDHLAAGLLAGLGAPATWGPERMKTSAGATAFDGVLGNHTSDFVRGVLRFARRAAATLETDPFSIDGLDEIPGDKTGWAPPGTTIDYVTQWLAALGLALLPVAHRPLERSATPTSWRVHGRSGVTLPLLDAPVSTARLRALLALDALRHIHSAVNADSEEDPSVADAARKRTAAADKLRTFGIDEVVVFERRDRSGAGSSVAFDFRRGRRVALK